MQWQEHEVSFRAMTDDQIRDYFQGVPHRINKPDAETLTAVCVATWIVEWTFFTTCSEFSRQIPMTRDTGLLSSMLKQGES